MEEAGRSLGGIFIPLTGLAGGNVTANIFLHPGPVIVSGEEVIGDDSRRMRSRGGVMVVM